MLAGVPGRPFHELVQALWAVVGLQGLRRRRIAGLPPGPEAVPHLSAVGDQGSGAGIGGGFLAEHGLDQGDVLVGIEEGVDDAEQMEGERAIAARPSRDMNVEPVGRHQRDELKGCIHELGDAGRQLVGRKLRPGLLAEAEELDDLLGALAESVLVAARQHRHRTHTEPFQLGHAGRVLEHID
jgi:hypothetical protein